MVDDASPVPVEADGVRVVRLEAQRGPAAARNAGIAAAAGPLLAFTDADCEPAPGWLSAVVAALEDADLVQGPIAPARPPGPYDRTVTRSRLSPFFETANLGVRRDLVDRVGGFSRLGFVTEGHFGEDVEFGWRARRAGARIVFAEDALVRHAVFPRGVRGHLRERGRTSLFPHLVAAVPELRDELTLRVFLTPGTARFDLAVAGIVAAVVARRPLPLLAALPYARRATPVDAAADAVSFVALIRGSIGARRLVL